MSSLKCNHFEFKNGKDRFIINAVIKLIIHNHQLKKMHFPGSFMDCHDESQSLIDISVTSSCDEHHQALIKKQSIRQDISGKNIGGFLKLLETDNEEIRSSGGNKYIKGTFGGNESQLRSTLKSTNQISQMGSLRNSVASQNINEFKQSIKQSEIKADFQSINSYRLPSFNSSQINSPKRSIGYNKLKDSEVAIRVSGPIKDSSTSNKSITIITSQKPEKTHEQFQINIVQSESPQQTNQILTNSILFGHQKSTKTQQLKNCYSSERLQINNFPQSRLFKTDHNSENTQFIKKYTSLQTLPSAMKKLKLRDYIQLDKLNGKRKRGGKDADQLSKSKDLEQSSIIQTDKKISGDNLMKCSSIFSTRRLSSANSGIETKLRTQLKNNIRSLQQSLYQTLECIDGMNSQNDTKQQQMMVIYTLGKIIKQNMMKGGNQLNKFIGQIKI